MSRRTQRFHLVRNDILMAGDAISAVVPSLEEIVAQRQHDPHAMDVTDIMAIHEIARESYGKTIMLDHVTAMELSEALNAFVDAEVETAMAVRPPFDSFILQFTQPVPESVLFKTESRFVDRYIDAVHEQTIGEAFGERWADAYKLAVKGNDAVAALVISVHEDEESEILTVGAWFSSSSVNRVAIRLQPGARLRIDEFVPKDDEIAIENKKTLLRLALAVMLYLSSANVETMPRPGVTDKQRKIDKKRIRKGKKPLFGTEDPYYFTRITKTAYEPGEFGSESDSKQESDSDRRPVRLHSVRAHFRRLRNGQTIWVRAHMRGLQGQTKGERVYTLD